MPDGNKCIFSLVQTTLKLCIQVALSSLLPRGQKADFKDQSEIKETRPTFPIKLRPFLNSSPFGVEFLDFSLAFTNTYKLGKVERKN